MRFMRLSSICAKDFYSLLREVCLCQNKGEISKISDFLQAIVTPSIEPRNFEYIYAKIEQNDPSISMRSMFNHAKATVPNP
jgi:hypothetical protein